MLTAVYDEDNSITKEAIRLKKEQGLTWNQALAQAEPFVKEMLKMRDLEIENEQAILNSINATGEQVEASNRRIAQLKQEKQAIDNLKTTESSRVEELEFLKQFDIQAGIELLDIQMENDLKRAEALKASKEVLLNIEQEYVDKKKELIESNSKHETEVWAEGLENIGETIGTWSNAVGGLYSAMHKNTMQGHKQDFDNYIKTIDEKQEKDIEYIKNNVKDEKEQREQIKAINEKANKDKKDARERLAEDEKESLKRMKPVKYAQAVSNTALGVSQALASAPPPFNIALAAITAAAGAIEIQTIAASEYEQGGLVGGKRHSQGGTLIEAEQGEFVMRRSAVESIGVENLNRMNQGGGATNNLTFYISGNVMTQEYVEGELAEQIRDAVRRGSDFGGVG
jgi:hypothetical protein